MAEATTSMVFVLTRLYWMMLGPFILAINALTLLRKHDGWLSGSSIVFLAFLAGLPLARWWELRSGNAKTATGETATPNDVRQYAILAIAVGLLVWVAANAAGGYLAPG
jgi:hypothetical protein